jgi:hypothetical protein
VKRPQRHEYDMPVVSLRNKKKMDRPTGRIHLIFPAPLIATEQVRQAQVRGVSIEA